jgi:hypothetical protein
MESAIAVEWTQPAFDSDLRFEVEVRKPDTASPFATVGEVAQGTIPDNGHFRFVHIYLVPGLRYEYRVFAVREALDPADSSASARRAIRSPPSASGIGIAVSATPLAPPFEVNATQDTSTGSVHLTWSSGDDYDTLLIYRRAPGRFGFERIAELDGMASSFDDSDTAAGVRAYQVRAHLATRKARSTIIEVAVS